MLRLALWHQLSPTVCLIIACAISTEKCSEFVTAVLHIMHDLLMYGPAKSRYADINAGLHMCCNIEPSRLHLSLNVKL